MKTIKLDELNILDVGHTIQLTAAVFSGNGKNYICSFPEEFDDRYEFIHLRMGVADWKKFLQQTDVLETEMLARAKDGTVTKAILRKSQRQIEQSVMWKVYQRDGYTCRYCGKTGIPLTVDHVIVWEEGGPSIEENLLTACRKCNRTRGNLSYRDWLTSGYYGMVATGLSDSVRVANEELIDTLNTIPRRIHQMSR
jgi:hypothetical protein